MPWNASDAPSHVRGLTAHQRTVWARVANRALAACRVGGGSQEVCEGRAIRQANAVAQRAPAKAIKADADGSGGLEILAVPFGGAFDFGDGVGRDGDGEFFTPATQLCLDWFPKHRPLLYEHGLDTEGIGVEPIGSVDSESARKDEAGWWVRAQLDKSHRYFTRIAELLDEDALFASSGAYGHLVRKAGSGEILRWPWVELSLTPNPSNPLALAARVSPDAAKAHYKSAGLDGAAALDAALEAAELKAGRRLSAASIGRIRAAIATLAELLGETVAAGDADDGDAAGGGDGKAAGALPEPEPAAVSAAPGFGPTGVRAGSALTAMVAAATRTAADVDAAVAAKAEATVLLGRLAEARAAVEAVVRVADATGGTHPRELRRALLDFDRRYGLAS